jgi:hypothetical protein
MEAVQMVQSLVEELNLSGEGYRLIIKGGKYTRAFHDCIFIWRREVL